jgi:hypothetical protein
MRATRPAGGLGWGRRLFPVEEQGGARLLEISWLC